LFHETTSHGLGIVLNTDCCSLSRQDIRNYVGAELVDCDLVGVSVCRTSFIVTGVTICFDKSKISLGNPCSTVISRVSLISTKLPI
jgi:hypothetical protein